MARPKIQFEFELVFKEAILHTLHPQNHVQIGTDFHFFGKNGLVGCMHFSLHAEELLQGQLL